MPDITFNCPHCDQRLEAPDDMAGEQLDCPACEQALTIPDAPAPAADASEGPTSAAEGSPSCPDCGADIEADAVICVSCGLNLKTGKKLHTDSGSAPDGD